MDPRLTALIETLQRLESMALSIYTKFASLFGENAELHAFWMSMARHEAAHVGALALIRELLEQGVHEVEFEQAERVAVEAVQHVQKLRDEAFSGVASGRAFALAVELESQEVEDIVLDLIHLLSDTDARNQAEQMLLHDLSDLSLMIEKHTDDEELLARVDSLVEDRVEDASRTPTIHRR